MRIKEVLIPTKYIFAPINTGYALDGNVNSKHVSFYSKRSGKGIGISFVGNVSVAKNLSPNEGTLIIRRDNLRGFKKLSQEILKNGSVPGIQLSAILPTFKAKRRWRSRRYKEVAFEYQRSVGMLSAKDIRFVLNSFLDAIDLSRESGFQYIQLHAAHGYFLSALLARGINNRVDSFSVTNDWFDEFINFALKKVNPGILGVRLNLFHGFNVMKEIYQQRLLVKRLIDLGVDIIDFSAGFYNLNKNYIYPPKNCSAPYLNIAKFIARKSSGIFSVSGNLRNLGEIEKKIPENLMLTIGRPLICDSEYIKKIIGKNISKIRECNYCGRCHYFSKNFKELNCKGGKNA